MYMNDLSTIVSLEHLSIAEVSLGVFLSVLYMTGLVFVS